MKTNSSNDEQRVISLLQSAEDIVSGFDTGYEPTPIGPRGVHDVVDVVSISASPAWGSDSKTSMELGEILSSQTFLTPFDWNEVNESKNVDGTLEQQAAPIDEFDALLSKIAMISSTDDITMTSQEKPSLPALQRETSSTCHNKAAQGTKRTRKYQAGQWNDRFDELLAFRAHHGHMFVPHSYAANQKLAQWVKRQRYQYKLKASGHHSTLSDEREAILTNCGFIWDSHAASWQEQFQLLEEFYMANGHCNVPTKFCGSTTLNVWCKHQRKQYKLYKAGINCTLTDDRHRCLESIGFNWNPRSAK